MILDRGGDLDELLGDELCDLGQEPLPMEHFFEHPAFRGTVRLRLEGLDSLEDPRLRRRVRVPSYRPAASCSTDTRTRASPPLGAVEIP